MASTLTEEDFEEGEYDDENEDEDYYSDLEEDGENELNSQNISQSGSVSKKRLSSRAVCLSDLISLLIVSSSHCSISKCVEKSLKLIPIFSGKVLRCLLLCLT